MNNIKTVISQLNEILDQAVESEDLAYVNKTIIIEMKLELLEAYKKINQMVMSIQAETLTNLQQPITEEIILDRIQVIKDKYFPA